MMELTQLDFAGRGADLRQQFRQVACDFSTASPLMMYLLSCLSSDTQFFILYRIVKKNPIPTYNDWRNLYRPVTYNLSKSWHFWTIVILAGLVTIVGLIQMGLTVWHAPMLFSWSNAGLVIAAIIVLFTWFLVLILFSGDPTTLVLIGFVTGPIGNLVFAILLSYGFIDLQYIIVIMIFQIIAFPSTVCFYFASVAALQFLAPGQVVTIWTLLTAGCLFLWVIGSRRHRAAQNPLHGILGTQSNSIFSTHTMRQKGLLKVLWSRLYRR
jgi:hypothetical protein